MCGITTAAGVQQQKEPTAGVQQVQQQQEYNNRADCQGVAGAATRGTQENATELQQGTTTERVTEEGDSKSTEVQQQEYNRRYTAGITTTELQQQNVGGTASGQVQQQRCSNQEYNSKCSKVLWSTQQQDYSNRRYNPAGRYSSRITAAGVQQQVQQQGVQQQEVATGNQQVTATGAAESANSRCNRRSAAAGGVQQQEVQQQELQQECNRRYSQQVQQTRGTDTAGGLAATGTADAAAEMQQEVQQVQQRYSSRITAAGCGEVTATGCDRSATSATAGGAAGGATAGECSSRRCNQEIQQQEVQQEQQAAGAKQVQQEVQQQECNSSAQQVQQQECNSKCKHGK
ncbi:transcription factor SPT20 homolog [Homarus americanus]|uniref:transcription factor SPT20 homolog n=1 Tax=Homarus americanus TaxID=6706 RepID=UPI001C46E2D9|nr:transcription factor SPT20 homolog [Homarus americanus]